MAIADTQWICQQARLLGFDLCGVVSATSFPELAHFSQWIERGFHGEMNYLEDPRRQDPSLVLDPLCSIVVCGLNYNTGHPYSVDATVAGGDGNSRGWISRYAWGEDYHEILWSKLNRLELLLKHRFTQPFLSRAYADTGPLAERVFGKYAGLGWLGKNTLLLNETLGSWFFLGVLLTSLELTPSLQAQEPPQADLCGNCRQCIDACPTGALVEPYVMDARRCISYLTIELRGVIPLEFREQIGRQVYGCDICQDVCPYNRSAPVSLLKQFQPRQPDPQKTLLLPELEWLAGLSEEEFREIFRGSAMKRAKWKGIVRNACIALGNAKLCRSSERDARAIAVLEKRAKDEDPVIAESAGWALSRI
ncbi:MAG: tRNA epoxyqueuosine(34) reductase QueG [Candidatus Acidiferrum sp.]